MNTIQTLKKVFTSHEEANNFVDGLKGEWQLGTTKEKTILVIYEEQIVESKPLNIKEQLKEARKVLSTYGWVESHSVMHNGVKTKYNYGTHFINEFNGKNLILNIDTVEDILKFDFVQAGFNT